MVLVISVFERTNYFNRRYYVYEFVEYFVGELVGYLK